jgi:hypothetical protein
MNKYNNSIHTNHDNTALEIEIEITLMILLKPFPYTMLIIEYSDYQ